MYIFSGSPMNLALAILERRVMHRGQIIPTNMNTVLSNEYLMRLHVARGETMWYTVLLLGEVKMEAKLLT